MHSDETLVLCAQMMGNVLQRELPQLKDEAKFIALLRGVVLMLERGVYADNGKLYVSETGRLPSLSGEPAASCHCAPRSNLTLNGA